MGSVQTAARTVGGQGCANTGSFGSLARNAVLRRTDSVTTGDRSILARSVEVPAFAFTADSVTIARSVGGSDFASMGNTAIPARNVVVVVYVCMAK
mmetsp:Transcript_38623/g.75870  ORF Transcript_38623/g.75870 Transcript_38623/m.75870 type:complete len:96 (+) Transcript_38623:750-1037(+)